MYSGAENLITVVDFWIRAEKKTELWQALGITARLYFEMEDLIFRKCGLVNK